MWWHSTVGAGDARVFRIEVAEPVRRRPRAGEELERVARTRTTRLVPALLYVETSGNLTLVEEIIRLRSVTAPAFAPDAASVIELARAHRPRVILMYSSSTGMSGDMPLSFCGRSRTEHIPLIAITAHEMPRDSQRLRPDASAILPSLAASSVHGSD